MIVDDFYFLIPCPELPSRFRARSSSCLKLRSTAVLDRRTFRLLLFRLLSFVQGERRTRGKILGWTERAGTGGGRGTEGFIIGQRCTGHGIKLSYAHLGIFYYHREGEHISSGSPTTARDEFFIFFTCLSFLASRIGRRANDLALFAHISALSSRHSLYCRPTLFAILNSVRFMSKVPRIGKENVDSRHCGA